MTIKYLRTIHLAMNLTCKMFFRPVFFLILLSLICPATGKAQQMPIYSQYTFNKFLLNPAAAGSDGYTSISVVAREQWTGFEGAPKTHAIMVDSRILKNSYIEKEVSVRRKKRLSSRSGRVGWAAYVFDDRSDLLGRTGIEGTYSYHLKINNAQLSLGLSGMFYQFRFDKGAIFTGDDEFDPAIDGVKGSVYVPDANLGIYYASANLYGGASIMQLLQSSVQFGDTKGSDYEMKRQYNLMAGYLFSLGENIILEPSFLMKMPTSARPQLDVTTRLVYKETYWGGLSYRTGNAFNIYLGARFDRLFFGYAFDYNFNSLMKYTYGSHEFMATLKFGENARRYRWLNPF